MNVFPSVVQYAHLILTNFITLIVLCEQLLCWNLQHRQNFWLRMLVWVPVITVPVLYFHKTGTYFYLLPFFHVGWLSYSFSLMVLLSSFLLWFCYREPYRRLLFYAVAAHVIQNMAYMVECAAAFLLPSTLSETVCELVDIAIYAVVFFLAWQILGRRISSHSVDVDNKLLLGFTISVALIVSVLNFWTYAFSYQSLASYVYQFVCDVLLLTVQFGIFDRSQIQQERAIMEHMYQTKEQQYQQSRENIRIINQKCHAMKMQIASLRENSSPEQARDLRQLENTIMIYDAAAHTGNKTLDTLLTEKGLLCEQYKIQMSCIAKGELLHFMNGAELYYLFGSMLDNAIQSLRKESPENRILSLKVAEQADFVVITQDNYCSVPIDIKDNLPVSRQDSLGIKSIQYVVEKYDGTLTTKYLPDENRFVLTVLFRKK